MQMGAPRKRIITPELHLCKALAMSLRYLSSPPSSHIPRLTLRQPLLYVDSDWLMAKNDDLHQLIVEQGKRQQRQAQIFNDVWAEKVQIANSKTFLESQQQSLTSDTIRLKNELLHT